MSSVEKGRALYISRVTLTNIRRFNKLVLNFDGKRGSSLLLSGDNGDGKSTVLRAIAIGLCDQSSAAALHRELPGEFITRGENSGTIKIELIDKGSQFTIKTKIESLKAFERITQTVRAEGRPSTESKFPWGKIFVSGYGTGVRSQGTSDFQDYLAVDAVYHLFKYDTPLQNPELAFRRLTTPVFPKDTSTLRRRQLRKESLEFGKFIEENLLSLLNLGKYSSVRLSDTGIEIKRGRQRFHVSSEGDGHKAITTLTLDLFGWWSLWLKLNGKRSLSANRQISGILLIDEVEQHLHPRWQLEVMSLFKASFPKLQIIATTHSPLVISGCRDFPVRRLDAPSASLINPYGWRVEDVYKRVLGLNPQDVDVLKRIDEYHKLNLMSLSGKSSFENLSQLRLIEEDLKSLLPGSDATLLSIRLSNIARKRKKEVKV